MNNEFFKQFNLYLRALSGIYERMLNYSGSFHYVSPSNYQGIKKSVNQIYANDNIGIDLDELNNINGEQLLENIKNEYQSLSISYKDLYKEALNKYFEHELDSEFIGNNLQDPQDQIYFDILKKQSGSRIFAQILAKAVQGDPKYQILLSKIYFLGWGTPVNIQKGLNWSKIAAESKDPEALMLAGVAEETYNFINTGCRLNENSLNYYKEAYERGNKDAAFAIYRYYKNYLTDYGSIRESKKWFNRGIEDNSYYCKYIIEEKPQENWAPRNIKNIIDWVEAAAEFNEPLAYKLLAEIYGYGKEGLEIDADKERDYLIKAQD